ncbi:class I SAM-dependent methyltransferase [Dyella soli]|uniref:class I SAM-dependent methyltransferase n=1 Tax=Dyella soli TaxID=522319 RepID=UPI0013F47AC7|nr:methyltransferase domain-containing protein [Dyella soli]
MDKQKNVSGLLGDTKHRDYAPKLSLFNRFAAPELRKAIASLQLEPGAHVLDAGCGTGEALQWLRDAVGDEGTVTGLDLSSAHVAAARAQAPADALVIQADLDRLPLPARCFDLVWSVNTINHLRDPDAGLATLAALLRPGGRLALGQSSLLPDMYFAWDSRLERLTNEAVRQYYRDRYALDERDLTAVRALVGRLRRAGLKDVRARTFIIERVSPVGTDDENYLLEAIFRATWGERLRPYLSDADHAELARLCDPLDPGYALRRSDFHFLQTFTLVVGVA